MYGFSGSFIVSLVLWPHAFIACLRSVKNMNFVDIKIFFLSKLFFLLQQFIKSDATLKARLMLDLSWSSFQHFEKVVTFIERPSKCDVTVLFQILGAARAGGYPGPGPQQHTSPSQKCCLVPILAASSDGAGITPLVKLSQGMTRSRIRRIFPVAVFKSQNLVSFQLSKRSHWPSLVKNTLDQ